MYLKYISQEEQVREKRGNHAQQFVRNTSNARMARGIILPCVSCLATALFLIPTLTFNPSMIGAEKSQISASAAVDYSLPYQSVGMSFSGRRTSQNMIIVNDWLQTTSTWSIPSDVDLASFSLSASATDNYGTDFEIWITVKESILGRNLYDSGWKKGGISNESVQMTSDNRSITVYFRIRYANGEGTNPPPTSMFTAVQWQIDYIQYVQTSEQTAFPSDWLVTTTAETPTIIDTSTTVVEVPEALTTTLAPSKVDEYMTLPAKVHAALLFTLSIIGRLLALKYVTPALCLGILVALAGWLLH